MGGGTLADVGSQIRLVMAASSGPGSLGGVRAAMARAAGALAAAEVAGDDAGPVVTRSAPRRPPASGPTLRPGGHRRTRRYAERLSALPSA